MSTYSTRTSACSLHRCCREWSEYFLDLYSHLAWWTVTSRNKADISLHFHFVLLRSCLHEFSEAVDLQWEFCKNHLWNTLHLTLNVPNSEFVFCKHGSTPKEGAREQKKNYFFVNLIPKTFFDKDLFIFICGYVKQGSEKCTLRCLGWGIGTVFPLAQFLERAIKQQQQKSWVFVSILSALGENCYKQGELS